MTYETPGPGPRPFKRIYRSREHKMFAGLCGGVGEYFNVDPNLVRVAFVAINIFGGVGVLAYLIAWAIVPEAPVSY